MTRVTIAIPIFNKKKYLMRCIRSVLDSSYEDYEVICVDDGSMDGSDEILRSFKKEDRRIKILNNGRNMGVAYSRNRAISEAKGEYIVFLDADDSLEQNALKTWIDAIEKADAQGCFISIIRNGEKEGIKKTYPFVYNGKELLSQFAKNDEMFLYACGTIWETGFLRDNGIFFEDLKIGEGGLFILSALLKAERVICSTYPGYNYFVNSESVSRNKDAMTYAAMGQAKQIIYMISQLRYGGSDVEIVEFLVWYLRKNIGGIMNLKKDDVAGFKKILSVDESFFVDLIGGKFVENSIRISENDKKMLRERGRVYLYGAGYETLGAMRLCNDLEVEILGIYVSQGHLCNKSIYGMRIRQFYGIKDKSLDIKAPFLVTAHEKHHAEIRNILESTGIKNIIFAGGKG